MASTESARRRNARGRGDQLREELVTAAVTVIDAEGDADRVSVRAIAREAGVSPTALYLHFPDRDALVAAAVDRGFAAFNAALADAVDPAATPHQQIRAMGLAYLEFAARQPAAYAVMFSARRPLVAKSEAYRDSSLDALAVTVTAATGASAQAAGEIALALWAALHGFATLRTARPENPWPSAERFVDRLQRGYLA